MARRKATVRGTGPSDVEIGLRLRAMRLDSGLSQNDLGKHLGVTFQQVQKYEKGSNRVALSRAIEIARILNTSLDQLVGGGTKLADGAAFDLQRYKLAQSFEGLDVEIAPHMRSLIDAIKRAGKKRR